MNDISRRLDRIEKKLHIAEPHLVSIAGLEMMSDEFEKLLKEISAESKGLQIKEYHALCAGDTENEKY